VLIQILQTVAGTVLWIVLIFLFIYQVRSFWYAINPKRVVFVPSKVSVIEAGVKQLMEKYLPDQSDYTFVEVGSGTGNVARFFERTFHFQKYLAIEVDFLVYWLGKFFNWKAKSQVEMVCQDIFKYTIPKKSLVYCYITHTIMQKLLEQGQLDGTIVIALTFKIPSQQYQERIDLHNPFYGALYLYDFRDKRLR
jgi:SAM-dependent methyltransferase